MPCGSPLLALADMQLNGNQPVTKLRHHGLQNGGDHMLVIALVALLAILAVIIALITASPLYRTLTLAFGSWAESVPAPVSRPRY